MFKIRLNFRNVIAIVISLANFSVGTVLAQNDTTAQEVVINGVKWATRNVDKPGTFAARPEDDGMFYQWNRKVAWAATGDVANWDSSNPTGNKWEKANDPSPVGWRVPSLDEIKTLLDTKKVTQEWTTQNGVMGRKFTDKTTNNSMFLPSAGFRFCLDGTLTYAGTYGLYGLYWSNTQNDSDDAYSLQFFDDQALWLNSRRNSGFNVRPVVE